jgi:ribosomal subunit interface protein
MRITIHAQDISLAQDFVEIANERLHRLERFNIRIDRLVVDVKHESNPRFGKSSSHFVRITSHGAGPLVRAEGRGFNDLAAFDEAAEAVELQLRKRHEREKDINHDTLRKRKAL